MEYSRQEVDTDVERRVLTGLIVSDDFCRMSTRILKLEYFRVKHYRRIAQWVLEYYKQYDKAPGSDIENIFIAEKDKLKQDESDMIEMLLGDISSEYVAGEKFNSKYLFEKTLKLCSKRQLEKLINTVDVQLNKGEIDKAEKLIKDFTNKVRDTSTSKWVNPFDHDVIKEVFASDENDELFKLPGALGELSGMLKREWLISFLGPMKRGKSWYLLLLAYEALTQGVKVVYISLEMSAKEVLKRLYAMITAGAKKSGPITVPVFDCLYNQDNSCEMEERENFVILKKLDADRDAMPIDLQSNREYRPCTYCRGKRKMDFHPVVWFTLHEAEELNEAEVHKKVDVFKKIFKTNLRVIDYPPYEASWDDIMQGIDDLEHSEGFVPSLICNDYFDIMGVDKQEMQFSERGQVDSKWKKGKREAKRRYCLMATVQQGNRGSLSKPDLENEDTSEDIRKLAHQDLQFGLNQTNEEKIAGIMRINVMISRHNEFNILGQVMVLQSLKLGMPFLDMEYEPKTYRRFYGGKKHKQAKAKQQPKQGQGRQPHSEGQKNNNGRRQRA